VVKLTCSTNKGTYVRLKIILGHFPFYNIDYPLSKLLTIGRNKTVAITFEKHDGRRKGRPFVSLLERMVARKPKEKDQAEPQNIIFPVCPVVPRSRASTL